MITDRSGASAFWGVAIGVCLAVAFKNLAPDKRYISEVFEYDPKNLLEFSKISDGDHQTLDSCISTAFAMASLIISDDTIEYHCCAKPISHRGDVPTGITRSFSTSLGEGENLVSGGPAENRLLSSLSREDMGCRESIQMECSWAEVASSPQSLGTIECLDPDTGDKFISEWPIEK